MINNYTNWNSFSVFFSAENTQRLLRKSYEKHNIEQAEQKSFENCYPFIYYLEHAQTYYQQAEKSPLLIQPILLFYGFVHLIKACILTFHPTYPENTSVLAHGVSTRKRKKQQYQFFQDEVKIQKHGLFPFIAEKMFHMKHLDNEKICMEQLFRQIPEFNILFQQIEGKSTMLKVIHESGSYTIPTKVLDSFHMTENRFQDFFTSKVQTPIHFKNGLTFEYEKNSSPDIVPIRFNLRDFNFYIPTSKSDILHFPEVLVHYLLLYNLSMIARYETEWWSELFKTMPNKDYPFICNFLLTSLEKGPFLVYQYLMHQTYNS